MAESIYKVIELVGTSSVSWEDAAKNADYSITQISEDQCNEISRIYA